MSESVVSELCALQEYLWTFLFVRVGLLWWGVAMAAGLIAFFVCYACDRRMGTSHSKALPAGLLVAYVAVVVAATVLSRGVGGDHWQGFLAEGGFAGMLRAGLSGPGALANALMLLPVGMLLPTVTGWRIGRTVLSCLAFSVWIEVVQLVCAVGYPDPSDVVLNVLGGAVGYGLRALAAAVGRVCCAGGSDGEGE